MTAPAPVWLDPEEFRKDYQQRRAEYLEMKANCDRKEEELREMEGLAARWDIQLDGGDERDLSQMTVRDAAATVLKECGRPLSMDELYETLVARGVSIGGDSPKNTLYGTLYNDKKRLVKIGKGKDRLWGLAGRDGATADDDGQ